MILRPAGFTADPGLRVLLLIDRVNTDKGDDALEELHQFLEESPENERLFIETTERRHATAAMLGSERDINQWSAIAKEGFAAEAAAAPAATLGALAGRAQLVAANEPWIRRHAKGAAVMATLVVAAVGASVQQYLAHAGEHRAQAESKSIALPDRSPVRLYAQSVIDEKYSSTERRVDIEKGGGAFKVEHDPRPFNVHAGTLVITAKGTQFNVVRRAERTDISLTEGNLNVFRNGVLLLRMKAGDEAHIRDSDGKLESTARRDLAVGGMTYTEVAAAFNKENAVFQIEVRGAARDMRIEGRNIVDLTAPEAWIQVIQTNRALRVTPTLGLMTIDAAPSN